MNGHAEEDVSASCDHVFDQFVTAVTCKSILTSFNQLLDLTGLRHASHTHFYEKLKAKLKGSWKAQNLWSKLDKRASHRDYKKVQACSNMRVLIIGSGPCGLRTAIECALLGAKTVVVEKRDRFSRNNVLHLWPYLITDLRNLGAKKFFGKFCAGAIDHISIRQLQCILLKAALLLGVEVHVNVTFEGLIEPPEDQSSGVGWKCKVTPENHAVSEYEFDVLIGADGKRNTLAGFRRKEFRGKLAIAVTANFINRNTQGEARVQEISGVAFIFNQKFFMDLKESTRIDLENIVYYKDDTHYFVMTAKKASLLEKGVLKEDYSDTIALLDRSNVDQERLMAFAREAADFSTNYQLPSLDYAVNHYGQADVAMFDFTSMFAAENASRFIFKNGHHLLMGLVGDSLLEPFWPTGSGCARGFLSAFDAAWMIRSWAMGKTPLQVLAERESIYTVLSQTTPNYLNKNYNLFSLDPNTRYPNLNMKLVKPSQVRHLYEGGVFDTKDLEEEDLAVTVPAKKPRNAEMSNVDSYSLLRWCQRVLNTGKYRDVHVVDFTSSWRSGLALCALIHSFRPEIINNTMLMECDVAANNQLAFNIAAKELGIQPVLTGEDMAKYEVPDKLTMVSYLAQFYDLFKMEPLPSSIPLPVKAKRKSMSKDVNQPTSPHSSNKRTSFFQKLSAKLAKSKKRKEQEENERSTISSKKLKEREEEKGEVELTRFSKLPMEEIANRLQLDRRTDIKVNKTEEMSGAVSVTAMADLLVAKFKSHESKPLPEPIRKLRSQPTLLAASAASEFCSFCHKRVYIMERMSAEGEFFHRGCLKCDHCGVGLRLTNYSCDRDTKPVKFYCYRHAIPEMRTRSQRKRGLEEAVQENMPEVVITPPPDVDMCQAPIEKSPRKAPPTHLTPLLLPKDNSEKAENTPERVEFEISFDGQEEESEEEQFEHNLGASLSSDTLLDDEDSDSELSDSDIESGAEDEVWENAVESFKSPNTPLTLEEACELRGNWRRQHSQENLVDAVEEDRTPSRGPEYSRLFGENGEDEESSTEVEEDSEYETDDSSVEEDSDEDNTEPAQGTSTDDHTEKSLKSPISPVSRLSASKASFFSEPPKVVSLDPWSMFGMGKAAAEKETEITENIAQEVKVVRRKSSATARKKSSTSESKSASERKQSTDSKKDMSSKDTDVSESLELDVKSADVFMDKGENMSPAGSLDELKEDLNLDSVEDVNEEKHSEGVDNVENVEEAETARPEHSILDSEKLEAHDFHQKMEEGSEGDDAVVENADEDDLLEKTALSQALEQLLQDDDHNIVSKVSASDSRLTESSESEENEMFLEGRLSPITNKASKKVTDYTRDTKEQQISHTTNSDSEAGRTESMSSGSSQPHSSESQSHSAETADDLLQSDITSDKSWNDSLAMRSSLKSISSDENCVEASHQSLEIPESHKVETERDDDSLRQVLESVAAMPDLSDNSDIGDLVLSNIDDRFVTDRRRKTTKKSSSKLKRKVKQKSNKSVSGVSKQEDAPVSNSSSILTPSDSESSVSSVEVDEFAGQVLEIEPGDDDIKPDQDMLEDYTTTMSLALGESYSDEVEEKLLGEEESEDITVQKSVSISDRQALPEAELEDLCNNKRLEQSSINEDSMTSVNDSSLYKDSKTTADNSSLYITPDVSLEKQETSAADISASTMSPLPVPHSETPVPRPRKSSSAASTIKDPTSDNNAQAVHSVLTPPHKENNRDSSGSEIFLSPMESTLESPFVNKQSLSSSSQTSSTSKLPAVTKSSLQPENSILSEDSSLLAKHPTESKKVTANSIAGSSQRKIPELPKLNIPTKEPPQSSKADITVDQPIMCSSPKLDKRRTPQTSTSSQQKRALPVPKSANKIHASKLSSTSSTASSKSPSSKIKNGEFAKPASPPDLKPSAKTKVPIDKYRLKLGSSSDHLESDHEMETKKKISAEGIVINQAFDDDIPFADESEAEEKFYTPCAPEKKGRPTFPAPSTSDHLDGRKKILPSSPGLQDAEITVTSAPQTRYTYKSDKEIPKIQAGQRAMPESVENLGVDAISSSDSSTASVLKRQPSEKSVDIIDRHSASYDSNSTSDTLSDSDDNRIPTATSSATEGDQKSHSVPSKGKKNKVKMHKAKKGQKDEIKDEKPVTKDAKGKSPLTLIHPVKSVENESNDINAVSGSNSTPKGGNGSSKKARERISKMNKSSEKKSKTFKARSDSHDDWDKTPTSENKKDLAICSVFHSEASNRQSKGLLGIYSPRKTTPLAAKASADEMSDSDESHISLSTMQRRRDEGLDERVARRLRKIQLKQQKRAEQKRLRMAQEMQRQLEEVEVRQRELEERGITVEKALRGDAPDGEDVDEGQLMSEWFTLVHEKNALLRYESELNVRAKELELEDRQARLEMDFRERSKQPAKAGGADTRHRKKETKTESDIAAEGHLLDELLDVVEQRNNLVAMLEEDRLREQKEDSDLKEIMAQKGFLLSPMSFDTRRKKVEAPLATYAL